MNTQPQRTAHGHQHAEAFSLMWYRCKCGHTERIWNSRDGVTPFSTRCPSCGQPDLTHYAFGSDQYAPNHNPHVGQRCWITMTKDRAEAYAKKRLEQFKLHQRVQPNDEEAIFNSIRDDMYRDGHAPDLMVFGYVQEGSNAPT